MRWRARLDRLLELDGGDWAVVQPLLLVGYFESYDSSLVSVGASTLSVGLGVTASTFAVAVAIIRFAGLGAIPVARWADRIGRRRLLMISMVGFTLATGLTAAAWSLYAFTLFASIGRVFIGTETAVATVAIAEDVDDETRGNALSILGAISGLGSGTLAVLLPLAGATWLGWRVLYIWPLLLMPLVAYLRRHLRETAAFDAARVDDRLQRGWWPTIEARLRPWVVRLIVVQFLYGAVETAGLFFASHLATVTYGWAGLYSVVLLASAPFGVVGFLLGGRFSDRMGRRPAIALSLLSLGVGLALVFAGGRWAFAPGYWLVVLANAALWPVGGAYMSELFPTEVRATLVSFVSSFQTLGAAIGLLVVGLLSTTTDVDTMMVVAAAIVAASALALRPMPETAGASVTSAATS